MVTLPVLPAPEAAFRGALAAAAVALLLAASEILHARRVRGVGGLAFGPGGRPSGWTRAAPALRVLSGAAAAFGLVTLLLIEPASRGGKSLDPARLRHLVVVLDVSPSMRLADAGPDGKETRRARAAALVRGVLSRVPTDRHRVSVVAVAGGALPVVVDTRDGDVLANILDDLPLSFAFRAGKTDLFAGLAEAARIARDWKPGSATVLVVTDGDTVPSTGLPRMPPSVSGTLLVGVGDVSTGRFIDGHMSRQDAGTLRQVAVRSGGIYHDGNAKQVPTVALQASGMLPQDRIADRIGLREWAITAAVAGTSFLALLQAALAVAGTRFRPGVRPPGGATILSDRRRHGGRRLPPSTVTGVTR